MKQIALWSGLGALALSGFILSSTSALAQKKATGDALTSKCIHEVNRVAPYDTSGASEGNDKHRLGLYRACLRNGGRIP